MPKTFGPYPARCVKIHDGDTLVLDIDLGFDHIISGLDFDGKTRLSCRVYGIDAPELSTQEGKEALAYAQTLVKPMDELRVVSYGWDKFGGRFDGKIILPDESTFAERMIEAGHAVPYK